MVKTKPKIPEWKKGSLTPKTIGTAQVFIGGKKVRDVRINGINVKTKMKEWEAEFAMEIYMGLKVEVSVIFD